MNEMRMRSRLSNARSQVIRLVKGYIFGNAFEREAARWFLVRGDETLRLSYPLSSSSLVIDCGGYEGDWAEDIYSRYQCRVLIFEPVLSFYKNIEARFSGNNFVRCYPFGLHSKSEQRAINLAGNASSLFQRGGNAELVELREVSEALTSLGVDRINLLKVNIEGGEYDLLERLIETGWIRQIVHLQVQFHKFVPDAVVRRERIRKALSTTHEIRYDYEFIWESWDKRVQ